MKKSDSRFIDDAAIERVLDNAFKYSNPDGSPRYIHPANLTTVCGGPNTGHGLTAGNPVYLVFTTGGAANGSYQVVTVPSSSRFTVTAADSATRSGSSNRRWRLSRGCRPIDL